MSRSKLYRSCLVLAFAAVGLLAGCETGKKHVTIKKEQTDRWNLTRIAVMYQLAKQQYEVGDYEKCKQTLADCARMDTPFAGIHTLSAKVDIEKGSLEPAATSLAEAIRINQADPEPYYLMGVIYQRWQKPEVAADFYAKAFEKKPGDPLYLLAIVEMKITLGQLDDAKKLLQDKLIYFEQTAAIRVALARIASLQGEKDDACKYYRDAVMLMPEDQAVRQSYAEALFDAGKYADAASIFEDLKSRSEAPAPTAAAKSNPEDSAKPEPEDKQNILVLLAQCYLELHRPFDARNTFQEITREHPDNVEAFIGLSRACISTNELSVALAAAKKVSRMEPQNVQAMILAGLTQQKMGRWTDSQTTLESALQLSPENGTVLCMLGLTAQHLDKQDEAATYFRKALDVNPNDTWAGELLAGVKTTPVSIAPAAQ